MSLKLEESDETHPSPPLWRKYYAGRGWLSLHRDLETERPILKWQADANVGRQPAARLYRIDF
jgi:hypothetical protein